MFCNLKKIGDIEKMHDETEFEWKITDFFTLVRSGKDVECPAFSFMDTSFFFRLIPRSLTEFGFVNLFLIEAGNLERSVEYYFGLKKMDGSISAGHIIKGILSLKSGNIPVNGKIHRYTDSLFFHPWLEIWNRKSELAPSDTLTVTCTLKRQNTHSQMLKAEMMTPPELQKFMKLETLSENFKSLLLNKKSCDTTLFVKDKEYKAHRAVLMARSSVFSAMFQHETSEKQTGIVNIPDCDPEFFGEFLEFLYTGKLQMPSPQSALHLYKTSEKYNVQELKILCSEFLMEKGQ